MQDTKIEWATSTHNSHHGCTKVDPGCLNCYAETMSERWGKNIWGPLADRQAMSDNYWRQLDNWNRKAEGTATRPRVFSNSMSDVFEGPETCQVPAAYLVVEAARERLIDAIVRCPNLDFLLLTKRPENMIRFAPQQWESRWPNNVWAGTSVSDQKGFDKRVPELQRVPAVVRFLSIEPLISNVTFRWRPYVPWKILPGEINNEYDGVDGIDWVIVGGESGHGARPMHPDWARYVRDQCVEAGIAFHFKQWGEYLHVSQIADIDIDFDEWRHLSSPGGITNHDQWKRLGKKRAGRVIDGRTWDEFPTPRVPTEAR